jgi:hypothetical protein
MTPNRLTAVIGCALALVATRGAAQVDAASVEPRALLQRAFDRTLRAPGVRSVELRIHRSGQLVAQRGFDVAYRRDAQQSQSLLRFTAPSWLEHLRVERWRLARLPDDGALAVIEARPERESQYGRLVVWVDRTRDAVARIDFFRRTETLPAKRLRVALDGVVEEAGYLRVETFRIEQLGRDDWTEVATQRMVIDPAIPAEVFSTAFLEREGDDLYALVARHADLEAAP